MPDHLPQVNFSDGEGVEEDDFNRLQSLLDAKTLERAFRVGGLAGTFLLDGASSGNPNGPLSDARPIGLSASRIITPDPLTFTLNDFSISGAGELTIDTGNFLLVQRAGAAAGTAPSGFAESFGGLLSYVPDDGEVVEAGNARPSTNPRWDSLDLALSHSQGGSESRDHEDAATRALTTVAQDKDQERTLLIEYNEGTEAATPTYPALTSGYGRYITVLRGTAETSLTQNNVRLHAFPGKLKIERVHGHNAWHDSTTNYGHNASRFGSLTRIATGGGGGTVIFAPNNIHEGCRLVGVGASFLNFSNDLDVDLVRLSEAAGVISVDSIFTLTSIDTSTPGYQFEGLADFEDAAGLEQPIWGNGRTYGPLFSNKEASPVSGVNVDRLALRINDASDWVSGDVMNYVEFYYLE